MDFTAYGIQRDHLPAWELEYLKIGKFKQKYCKTLSRPSFKIDANNPGTEVACETAAALAAGSILFRKTFFNDIPLRSK